VSAIQARPGVLATPRSQSANHRPAQYGPDQWGLRVVESLKRALSWLVVFAVGARAHAGLLDRRGNQRAACRKKPIRPANTVFDSREKDKQWRQPSQMRMNSILLKSISNLFRKSCRLKV
jgi:hypothetical protein